MLAGCDFIVRLVAEGLGFIEVLLFAASPKGKFACPKDSAWVVGSYHLAQKVPMCNVG